MLYLLPLLSSLILSLAFYRTKFGWLVLVGLAPLLYLLITFNKKKHSNKRLILCVWVSGLVFYLITTFFVIKTNPSNWPQVHNSSATIFGLVFWIGSSLVFSIGFLIFALLSLWFKKFWKRSSLLILLVLPAIWILSDYVRSWLFSLFWYGHGATIGANWNFGSLGFGAVTTPLANLSRILGLYGLTFVIVMVNIAIVLLVQKKWKPVATILSIILLLLIFTNLIYRTPNYKPKIRVAAVQIASDDTNYSASLNNIINFNSYKKSNNISLLALPEYSDFLETSGLTGQKIIRSVFKNSTGLITYSRHGSYSYPPLATDEIVYANQGGQIFNTQIKHFLIPGGEYLPTVLRVTMSATGHSDLTTAFDTYLAISNSKNREYPVTYNGISYGTLACSGAVAPELYRNMSRQGANILINSASLVVFSNAQTYAQQSKQIMLFQAIANDKPFIQAARGGYSYIVSPNGKILSQTTDRGTDLLTATISPSNTETIYTRLGEFTIPLSFLLLLGLSLNKFWGKSQSNKR